MKDIINLNKLTFTTCILYLNTKVEQYEALRNESVYNLILRSIYKHLLSINEESIEFDFDNKYRKLLNMIV